MLNSKQKRVAIELTGNTIVSASPGTGKTKTLVARAQNKIESLPKHKSLALITYTNAGADEISSRLYSEDNIFVGTIHRFCLEYILRPFGWIYKWEKPRVVTYDELQSFIEANDNLDLGDSPMDELNKIKRRIDGGLDNSIEWNHAESLENVAELFYSFIESKKAIDFNEILYRSYKIISENDFVANSLANKFYEISIDEFQDTNIFQYEIFKIINSKVSCTFFIVGDEKQKIFKFAGAIDDAFRKASIDFNAPIENLDVTYRSTSNIINAYSSLFDNHPVLKNESKYKTEDCKLIIKEINNTDNSDYIRKLIDFVVKANVSLEEMAVLTTSWQTAFAISRVLRKEYHIVGLGALPHRNPGSSAFNLIRCISKFICSPLVKNLRATRRAIDLHALENNLIVDERGLTYIANALITKIKNINLLDSLSVGLKSLDKIFSEVFDYNHCAINEILESINVDEADQWTFEKYIKTLSGAGGITVNTIHQSKGLEYEVVFLSGINENRLPYQRFIRRDGRNYIYEPLTNDNMEVGRTLLYVGVSRAKAQLIITHNWMPSMFISNIRATNN